MLVSYQWLKDYVDIDMDPQELADKLTMVGLEVSSVTRLGPNMEGVLVGYVEHVDPHPNSDRLSLCRVDIGKGEPLNIVCGAPNVAAGQKVPVAMIGTCLPNGQKIEKAVIRKVESHGMICSGDEMGLDGALLPKDQQEGIMVLPEDSVVGDSVEKTLNLDDTVFEIDLTPNRADCMSIRNIAREVGAIAGLKLKPLDLDFEESTDALTKDMISVEIKDPDLCGRYVARVVTGVTIGPSPAWLQNRLRAVGVRPISNIVDVTNFVMMEMGQPLHAFDYRFLEEKTIVVRRAGEGEKIITLDGQERQLDENTLVIADGKRPVAIAGIMGGENSEIMEDTTTVLIESANFNMVNIRRSSKRLGLRSESSMRFEKGVNIEGAREAADRAAKLMAYLGGGRVASGVVDNYPRKWTPVKIELNVQKVNNLLDLNLSKEKIVDLLESIDLKSDSIGQDALLVTVPPFRLDIEREIDLVEEVARLYGYEKIPLTIPEGDVGQQKMTWEQVLERKCKEILTGCGLTEV
ncbi:MAG TPA: phenylalanine--tRNA ligase subunit beta, partial [Clostridia bacterium]|nr:phenylalanine--tRNA ligase subunit beta [Clostridia bacterium]